ncbi:MAG: tRNA (N(6)-L-threonylcarbamoyladenosine(37)-C(2))-methylthiotransferase MtaB [Bdellovibrionaceae bacterium]|nr:tRNA (N(6)-L-threonylcarbamoyladenosine(37)-C(2))-methylthiotransferase MtaB [Pseudobdellovibrionaceae bacterium]
MDHALNYRVHSFGCKVNTYDTGLLQRNLGAAGFQSSAGDSGPRIHVLNTCAVTAEATKEAVRLIRRLKARDPFCTVVVTGCAAQVDTGSFENLPGADLVVANSHKGQLPELLSRYFKKTLDGRVFKSNIFRKDDLEAGGGVEKHHTRTFLKIQDGCNSFCTYCVIPFARGKSRSIPVMDLVARVRELEAQGAREIVLTGVHIGDYEDDTQPGRELALEDLLEHLLAKTAVPRFRLSSLEPVEVTERLLDLYQNPRMCPHFHMSIQSANTEVLAKMKRKYTQEDVKSSLLRIRERVPGAFVGMDVIVGFPTESEEQFLDTVACLRSLPWTRLHVFPYSERPGTRAAAYEESVYPHERARRAAILRDMSLRRHESEARTQIGSLKKVLVLNQASKGGESLSRDYWPVAIPEAEAFLDHWRGQEIEVRVTGYRDAGKKGQDGLLVAEVLA